MMPSYRDNSLEEMRVADYAAAVRHNGTPASFFAGFANPALASNSSSLGSPSHSSFGSNSLPASPISTDVSVTTDVAQAQSRPGSKHTSYSTTVVNRLTYYCITMMPQYHNKSLEELRLEDYLIANKAGAAPRYQAPPEQIGTPIVPDVTSPSASSSSSSSAPSRGFVTQLTPEMANKQKQPGSKHTIYSTTSLNRLTYYCITMMPEYRNKSLEELRLEDYLIANKAGAAPRYQAPPEQIGTPIVPDVTSPSASSSSSSS
eukprot:CAMPEP_0201561430 /NCGR_PEP_ID=MMETSP0173_2-20130828/78793_1 /ASSEMBLY_ACC=CAM_ASM_000268 /TAXON_ID=218659 /ORGANISM="Vexillifera sp., Strain DIVA3 564/2" /LENGTH=259 /DNA_ID=CAMNT_0047975931 /DNA_START=75 /DNA_END=851 /DNA_ORIENTATION=-